MAPQVGLEPTTLRLTVGGEPSLLLSTGFCPLLRISCFKAFSNPSTTLNFFQDVARVPGISTGHEMQNIFVPKSRSAKCNDTPSARIPVELARRSEYFFWRPADFPRNRRPKWCA